MADTPPIPPAFWARFLAFLRGGGTGQVVFHVRHGRVLRGELHESFSSSDTSARGVVDSRAIDRVASDRP